MKIMRIRKKDNSLLLITKGQDGNVHEVAIQGKKCLQSEKYGFPHKTMENILNSLNAGK